MLLVVLKMNNFIAKLSWCTVTEHIWKFIKWIWERKKNITWTQEAKWENKRKERSEKKLWKERMIEKIVERTNQWALSYVSLPFAFCWTLYEQWNSRLHLQPPFCLSFGSLHDPGGFLMAIRTFGRGGALTRNSVRGRFRQPQHRPITCV